MIATAGQEVGEMNRKRAQGKVPPGAAPLWRRWAGRLMGCDNAAISPMFALLLIPIVGSVAFAVELGGFYYVQRSAQNAADAAALAAASNDNHSGTGTTFEMEADAAAQKYGYVDGSDGVDLETTRLAPCPSPLTGSVCYRTTISSTFPLTLSRVVGFTGDTTSGQTISATAIATPAGGGGTEQVCAWTKSSDPNSFTSNGGPRPDMEGCTLFSNGGMTCNGHDLGADYGVAVGTSSGCGAEQVSGATPLADPYDALKSNIPSTALSSCGGSFPQLFRDRGNWTVATTNQVATGTPTWSGTQKIFCGDVQLTGDVTLTGTTTLIIENGRLDLNGHTLRTGTGAAATVIFSGNNNTAYSHYPTSLAGGGTLTIEAPDATSTSAWKGVAVYQDPAVSANTSFTYSGNAPTWNITGLVYLPTANVNFAGVVNKAADGVSCFVIVTYTMLVNGTAQIFANTDCASAGLGTPSVTVGSGTIPKLVY
jgi:hypothetical protein